MTFSATAVTTFNSSSAAQSATSLVNGAVELLDAGGVVLASASLGTPTSAGAVTTMGGFPKTVNAIAAGTVASARYRTATPADWKTGMTVGAAGSGAEVILTSLALTVGQPVQFNSANLTHSGTAA